MTEATTQQTACENLYGFRYQIQILGICVLCQEPADVLRLIASMSDEDKMARLITGEGQWPVHRETFDEMRAPIRRAESIATENQSVNAVAKGREVL